MRQSVRTTTLTLKTVTSQLFSHSNITENIRKANKYTNIPSLQAMIHLINSLHGEQYIDQEKKRYFHKKMGASARKTHADRKKRVWIWTESDLGSLCRLLVRLSLCISPLLSQSGFSSVHKYLLMEHEHKSTALLSRGQTEA